MNAFSCNISLTNNWLQGRTEIKLTDNEDEKEDKKELTGKFKSVFTCNMRSEEDVNVTCMPSL